MTVRKVIAYLLLLSFLVVWTPRSLWHECENSHPVSKHNNPKEVHFKKGHCFVCDFDLYSADLPVTANFYFLAPDFTDLEVFFLNRASFSAAPVQLRGPPAQL
jgi:hypothetical protein